MTGKLKVRSKTLTPGLLLHKWGKGMGEGHGLGMAHVPLPFFGGDEIGSLTLSVKQIYIGYTYGSTSNYIVCQNSRFHPFPEIFHGPRRIFRNFWGSGEGSDRFWITLPRQKMRHLSLGLMTLPPISSLRLSPGTFPEVSRPANSSPQ